jgi:hypothetical protein
LDAILPPSGPAGQRSFVAGILSRSPQELGDQRVALSPGATRITSISGMAYPLFPDHDQSRDFTPDEAELAISDAREAIAWFRAATREQQEAFLTLLLFRPR